VLSSGSQLAQLRLAPLTTLISSLKTTPGAELRRAGSKTGTSVEELPQPIFFLFF
jgi:hypothetical protein